jgi:hypothetical protein
MTVSTHSQASQSLPTYIQDMSAKKKLKQWSFHGTSKKDYALDCTRMFAAGESRLALRAAAGD